METNPEKRLTYAQIDIAEKSRSDARDATHQFKLKAKETGLATSDNELYFSGYRLGYLQALKRERNKALEKEPEESLEDSLKGLDELKNKKAK